MTIKDGLQKVFDKYKTADEIKDSLLKEMKRQGLTVSEEFIPMSRNFKPRDWFLGDRVTREIYLDDGTWMEHGDKCLPGPLKHGRITRKDWDYRNNRYLFEVLWDSGKYQYGLLWHGLDPEVNNV